MSPETRASLILRLDDVDNHDAWDEFVSIYEPLLMSLASRFGMQPSDAADVVQETLIAVSNSVADYEPDDRPASFRRWLSTITRNKLIDQLSSRAVRERGSGDTNVRHWLEQRPAVDSDESVWDIEQRRQVFRWAASAVARQVSAATWQAFYRTSVQNESVQAVADSLGIQCGMVYVARSRVMVRLRKSVDAWTQSQSEQRR